MIRLGGGWQGWRRSAHTDTDVQQVAPHHAPVSLGSVPPSVTHTPHPTPPTLAYHVTPCHAMSSRTCQSERAAHGRGGRPALAACRTTAALPKASPGLGGAGWAGPRVGQGGLRTGALHAMHQMPPRGSPHGVVDSSSPILSSPKGEQRKHEAG